MIIDVHTHLISEEQKKFKKFFKIGKFGVNELLKAMDREGIDKSVVLPLENPENIYILAAAGNFEVIKACRKHPDRLIPFCCLDPRNFLNSPKADLSEYIKIYKEEGFAGIGEICASLPIEDKRYKNLFHHASVNKMPMLFHFAGKKFGTYGIYDKLNLPGLEKTLKEFPDAVFIGHSAAFWGEIDGDLTEKERDGYRRSPIKKKGSLWKLLEKHPNLYADMSAGSGNIALSRDPKRSVEFIEKFSGQILFGSDRFIGKNDPRAKDNIDLLNRYLTEKKISKTSYDSIMYKNFKNLIN